MAADWTRLIITEQGGFTGLLRGAELRAEALDEAGRERVARCLAALQSLPQAPRPLTPAAHPDRQSLHLECHADTGHWSASFDAADLPEPVLGLLEGLKLVPFPPR